MSYPSISPVGLSQPLPTILPKASPTGVINPIRAISGNDPDRMRAIATKYREALDNPFIDSATRARLQGAFGLQPDPPTGGGSAQAGPMPQTGGPAFPKPGGSFPKPGPMGPGGSFMPREGATPAINPELGGLFAPGLNSIKKTEYRR